MNKLAMTAAAGLAMLAATTELVRAQDGGEVTVHTKPLITESKQATYASSEQSQDQGRAIEPWETRETGFAAPDDVTKRMLRHLHYADLIEKYAAMNGVPVELATAVIQIESNFRPTVRGSAGEIGLMQVKPATARLMGYRGTDYGLFDPETNIRFGMKYLAGAQALGDGKICGTILKYNAGHGAKRMNPVSQRYCNRVKTVIAEARDEGTSLVADASGPAVAYGRAAQLSAGHMPLVF
jgi:soluble lytic murein transglycosylase-like protein